MRLLTFWALLVVFSLAVDGFVVYLAYLFAQSALAWPVVKFALGVFVLGAAWFAICDQWLEIGLRPRERGTR